MEGRLMLGDNKETGYLEIKRGDRWIICCCPYNGYDAEGAHSTVVCGDWCPLFGEPAVDYVNKNAASQGVEIYLQLCHRTLYFDKFEDLRN